VRVRPLRDCRIAWLLLGSLVGSLVFGCGTSGSNAAPPPSETDAGVEDAGPPPLDPRLFDCTSPGAATKKATRASTTAACIRDPKCKGRFVAGHRGAGGDLGRIAPEDSLAAYRAAIAMGADLVETDPRPTADGVLVNVHDTTVDRIAEGTGEVAKMTLVDLQRLKLKTEKFQGDFTCERIPTFEDVLAQAKGGTMVLVDANKTDRVDLLVAAIQKTDTLDWAIFDTSDTKKIDDALKLEPRLLIQVRADQAAEVPALIAQYAAHPPVFVEISQTLFPTGANETHAAGLRALTNAFGADLGVRMGQDRATYPRLYDKGADALQTELPDEVLKSIGRTVPPP
jgi:glycerophosphoryl diester phosphodiesterase